MSSERTAIVAQSAGSTAVINSGACTVLQELTKASKMDKVIEAAITTGEDRLPVYIRFELKGPKRKSPRYT